MQYCQRCLYPANHPLKITFDHQGVCSGCRIHEEKDRLNWLERGAKLKVLLKQFQNRSGRNYDCIIPVSGARDSYFIVHLMRNVYGMNPLLVSYNKQYNTRIGIRNLAYLRTLFNRDFLQSTVSPAVSKRVTRATLKRLGSMYWHCLAGQTVYPVQTAVRFKIPLIIWGVHQGCDQVGMFSHLDEVEMTRKYRKDHDLMGVEAEDLIGEEGLTRGDLTPFIYPHDKELETVGVRGIYLSNYIRWDTKKQHEDMLGMYHYETANLTRTFDRYNDVDCVNYADVHDYIKFLKWGYGKVTDHACREIRFGRLTREEGIDLVQQFQDIPPQYLDYFFQWLHITEEEFYGWIDAHRDPFIWQKGPRGEWQLKDMVIHHRFDADVDPVRLPKQGHGDFILTASRVPGDQQSAYSLTGRGYVDETTGWEPGYYEF